MGRFTHVVQPGLQLWFRHPAVRRFRGRRLPGGKQTAEHLSYVGVTVRLSSLADLTHLLGAEGDALRLTRVDGQLARLGTIVAARVTATGLALLASLPGVERVELDMLSPMDPPLDVTGPEIQAGAVWSTLDTAGLPISGEGVIIADIDSGIDPTHPAFFRADGGYYDWIDVNGDGQFTPGVDAVDWNRNGVADPGEAVGFVDGVVYSLYDRSPILDTSNGIYDLGWDYLFLDSDHDGHRSFGVEEGFGDDTPTFGEQLLVADDVNRNGRLDPGERLVALSTPKIRAVRSDGHTFLRGVDLTQVPVTADAMHGTGVSGILVGGQRGFSALVGIAPEADLLLASTHNSGDPTGSLVPLITWAAQQGAQVMLHEYAPWVGYHMDGSSNHEQLMDQAAAQGIPQVNPAGNLGGSKKHAVALVPTQGFLELPLVVPQPALGQPGYTFLQLGLLWRDPQRTLHLDLRQPGGGEMSLGATGTSGESQVFDDGRTWVYAWRDDSPRGTAMFGLYVFGYQGGSYVTIPSGSWSMSISDPETQDASVFDVRVAAYVMDDVSGWGLGAHYPEHTSEEHLICFPATADSAITLSAYTGHAGEPYSYSDEPQGALRRYSGRGVRIDGVPILDVAAPDNPITALNRMSLGSLEVGSGSYTVFGGTSGAGPHVAGAAALIKQLRPGLSGYEVRDAIREGALVDDQVVADGVHPVEALWGAGKLRIHQALYGTSPAPNTPPGIVFDDVYATAGSPVLLRPVLSDEEDDPADLHVRWDDGYDGTWDAGPLLLGEGREVVFPSPGIQVVKAQVVDSGGLTAEAIARIHVIEGPTCDGALCPDGGGPGQDDGPRGCGCQARGFAGPWHQGAGGAQGAGAPLVPILTFFVLVALLRRRSGG